MFRLQSRHSLCATIIVLLYFAVIYFVLRDPANHSDMVPSNLVTYILRFEANMQQEVEDCGQRYGIKMFDVWKSTKFEICTNKSTSKITCYLRYDEAVTRRLCILINTKIRLHEPYYVANTSNLSSLAAIDMRNDIVSADCEPVGTIYDGAGERKMEFDSLFRVDQFRASRMLDFQCSHSVSHTVFWIWRWDATNAYHFLEDVTNTFVSLILFDEDPNKVEIAIYDGMNGIVNNPLFTLWSELFPKGVRIIRNDPFPQNTCFARSITSMYGMRSHFTEFGGYKTDTHCISPILKGFRNWAIDKLQIVPTSPRKRLTLILISRQQYLPTRNITRVLVNEGVIIETIKTTFPSLNVVIFRPESLSTFKEQAAIAIQGNIVIGVHGAGLVYSMFMSPGSHLIEIFMHDRDSTNRHYHNIATWMDLQYHSIEFFGKVIPPENIVNVIDVAVKDLIKMSTTAARA